MSILDESSGTLNPRIYIDPNLYQLEQERVFGKSWLFLAHASQLPNPGDYVTTYMGEDPVVVARQPDGSVRAFLNVCRHRAMRICRSDAGNAKSFTCSYHGWTYDTAGCLRAIPMEELIYRSPVDRDKWSAVRVPRVHDFHGFLFGTWDTEGPSFEEYIGDVAWYLDPIFGGADGIDVLPGIEKWSVAANWKHGADQFVSDNFHFMSTHAAGMGASLAAHPAVGARLRPPTPNDSRHAQSKYGHGIGFSTDAAWHEARLEMTFGPEITSFLSGPHREGLVRKFGEAAGRDMGMGHGCLFPNFGFLGVGIFRVFHPKGPDAMEIWNYVMAPKGLPQELRNRWRIDAVHAFGCSGIFELEDTEQWTHIQRGLRAPHARGLRLNVQMGHGQTRDPEGRFPGTTDAADTEEGVRAFYRRWTELMGHGLDQAR